MSYIIVSGYYNDPVTAPNSYYEDLFEIWWNNTISTTMRTVPEKIYIINSGGNMPEEKKRGDWIDLNYNLGHVCDCMPAGRMPGKHAICGWSMGVLMGAFLAYSNNCDLVYKEQDCLAFGPWAEALGSVLRDGVKITTGKLSSDLPFKVEQSLFGVKYDYLLPFVYQYLNIPEADYITVPEHKWLHLIENVWKEKFAYLPFGYGRQRPVNYKDTVFYVQHDPVSRKISEAEFNKLKQNGLI
jgi:hypothetical protein